MKSNQEELFYRIAELSGFIRRNIHYLGDYRTAKIRNY